MSESTLIAYDRKITRQELALVPTPAGTATHQIIPHHEVVNALIETLGFRHIAVVRDEYAVDRTRSQDVRPYGSRPGDAWGQFRARDPELP